MFLRRFFVFFGVGLLVNLFVMALSFSQVDETKLTANIDFSGVEKFLEITALLEKDIEPPSQQWDELFSTPGYEVLIRNEFKTNNFFMERIQLAFKPSKKNELEARLKEEKGWVSQFLKHFVRAKKERAFIEEKVEELKKLSFVEAAVKEARKFLPQFEIKTYPPISFVVFGPDARGYVPVVLDILYTADRGEGLITFVAHEFHHYYRNLFFDCGQDQQILWVINQVQAEGIADQINIGLWFHDESLYPEYAQDNRYTNYLEWYKKSPEILGEMDRLFSEMFDYPEKKGKLGSELQKIVPQSGHPTGFFMANLILEQMGRDALIGTVKNPFAFFRVYKEAADKKGGDTPTFSDKTIEFIQLLENRYFR